MRRRAAALALAAALLAGCAPQEAGPTPVQWESPAPSPTAVPAAANPFALAWDPDEEAHPLRAGAVNQTVFALVYEGLFTLDGGFSPQGALCQSYTHTDNALSWTFTLREGARFSDGTPLTAAHVADSLNAARAGGNYQARLDQVAAVLPGEGAVTVELSVPNGNLPALLDVPIFLPGQGEGEPPLGTGPYRFDWTGGEPRLAPSPHRWEEGEPPAREILLRPVLTAGDRIAAFDTGLVSLVDTDLTATGALGYAGSYETWDYPTSMLLYLGFNTSTGVCREGAVRQAAARCIPREAVAQTVFAGHALPAALPVSPACGLYDGELARTLDFDPEEAVRLLEEAGYALDGEGRMARRGRQLALTLAVNSENTFRAAAADAIAAALEELGVAVTVRKLMWDDFTAALRRGSFDLYLGQVKLTADFDPGALLAGELNYSGYASAQAAPLLAGFRAALGEERTAAACALCAQLAQDMPLAPVCFLNGSVLTRWGVAAGLSPVQGDPFHGLENWEIT